MTSAVEENKDIVRRYYDDLWNKWDLVAITELVSADITFRGSLGITAPSHEGFKDYVNMVRAAFPDFHKIEELIAEGSKVVARLTYAGTHQEENCSVFQQLAKE